MSETIKIRDLSPDKEYSIQIRGVDIDGEPVGEWSYVYNFTPSGDVVAPASGAITVTNSKDDFKIVLNSGYVESTDFKNYVLEITNGVDTVLKDLGTSPNYTLTLAENTALFGSPEFDLDFVMRFYDHAGNFSTSATVQHAVPPLAAPVLSASEGITQVTLTWTHADLDRVKEFIVKKDTVEIARVTGNSYTHTNSDTADYVVEQVDKFGRIEVSNTVNATGLTSDADNIAPNPPTNVTADVSRIYADLPSTDTDASAYDDRGIVEFKYSVDAGATYKYVQIPDERATSASTTVSVEHDAQAGQTIQYECRVRDTSFNYSTWAAGTNFNMPTDSTPPAVPTNLSASGGVSTIFVSWTNPSDDDLAGVEVAVDAPTTGPSNVEYDGIGSSFSMDFSGEFEVHVRAYDHSGNYSAWAGPVTGETLDGLLDPSYTGLGEDWLVIRDDLNNPVFFIGKTAGGVWELHLATDMFIDSGGDLNMSGGDISLTSGNFTMSGGNMNLSGGTVTYDGAPVNIDGSNFTITDGKIVVDGVTGSIESSNFSDVTNEGYKLDNTGLTIYDGTISAGVIEAQNRGNLLGEEISVFNNTKNHYVWSLNEYGQIASLNVSEFDIVTNESFYGSQSLKLTDGEIFFVNDFDNSYIDLPEGDYWFSFYAKGVGEFRMLGHSGTVNGDVTPADSGLINVAADWTRYWVLVTVETGDTQIGLGIDNDTGTSPGNIMYIDAMQLEPAVLDEPGVFNVGGPTTIEGNKIRTGAIESNNFVTGVSGFQINMDGDVEFGSGEFRGDVVGANISGSSFLTDSGQYASTPILWTLHNPLAGKNYFGDTIDPTTMWDASDNTAFSWGSPNTYDTYMTDTSGDIPANMRGNPVIIELEPNKPLVLYRNSGNATQNEQMEFPYVYFSEAPTGTTNPFNDASYKFSGGNQAGYIDEYMEYGVVLRYDPANDSGIYIYYRNRDPFASYSNYLADLKVKIVEPGGGSTEAVFGYSGEFMEDTTYAASQFPADLPKPGLFARTVDNEIIFNALQGVGDFGLMLKNLWPSTTFVYNLETMQAPDLTSFASSYATIKNSSANKEVGMYFNSIQPNSNGTTPPRMIQVATRGDHRTLGTADVHIDGTGIDVVDGEIDIRASGTMVAYRGEYGESAHILPGRIKVGDVTLAPRSLDSSSDFNIYARNNLFMNAVDSIDLGSNQFSGASGAKVFLGSNYLDFKSQTINLVATDFSEGAAVGASLILSENPGTAALDGGTGDGDFEATGFQDIRFNPASGGKFYYGATKTADNEVATKKFPRIFQMRRAANQSIADSTAEYVAWDTTDENTASEYLSYNSTSRKVEIVKDCIISISTNLRWASNSTGERLVLIDVDAGKQLAKDRRAAQTASESSMGVAMYVATAGEDIGVLVRQTSGGALNMDGDNNTGGPMKLAIMVHGDA